jgi:RND family efflux transporter MFP subunit
MAMNPNNASSSILSPTGRAPAGAARMARRSRLPSALAALLPLAVAAWMGASTQPARAASGPSVTLVQPQLAPRAAVADFEIDGSIQPVRQATVAAQTGGSVLALSVKAGDRVRAGQWIARVDARDVQAGVDRADAALAQARAEFGNAQSHLQRTRDLKAQGFVSQAALDVAQTQARAARAGVEQAEAARAQASLARGFATVNAPFDGIVLATHLDTGDLAVPGRPVVTLYAPGALRAVVRVPASRATAARAARKVEVELGDGRRLAPVRRTELAMADPVSQTIEWRLDLPVDARIAAVPGQSVRVHFADMAADEMPASGARAAAAGLRLPSAAVLRRGELTAVYVAQPGGFALRAVRLGAEGGEGEVEIVAGLKPGERVASDALRAGLAGAIPAQ